MNTEPLVMIIINGCFSRFTWFYMYISKQLAVFINLKLATHSWHTEATRCWHKQAASFQMLQPVSIWIPQSPVGMDHFVTKPYSPVTVLGKMLLDIQYSRVLNTLKTTAGRFSLPNPIQSNPQNHRLSITYSIYFSIFASLFHVRAAILTPQTLPSCILYQQELDRFFSL